FRIDYVFHIQSGIAGRATGPSSHADGSGGRRLAYDLHARGDWKRWNQRAIDRTALRIHAMHALHGVTHSRGIFSAQIVAYMHPLDEQHITVVLDFTAHFATEAAFFGVDFARIQRAGKGAKHSTAEGGDDVVDGGGVGLGQPALVDAVMFGDTAMDAEQHGLRFSGQVGAAQRALDALDPHVRCVDDFGHGSLRYAKTFYADTRGLRGADAPSDFQYIERWGAPPSSTQTLTSLCSRDLA